MWKILISVLKLIAPIGLKDKPEGQQSWRWAVFAVLMLYAALGLMASGHFPGLPSPYVARNEFTLLAATVAASAKSADMQAVQGVVGQITTRLDFITKQSIEQSIRSKLTTACMTDDRAFKQELNDEVQQLEDQYYALTKEGYRQPACGEL